MAINIYDHVTPQQALEGAVSITKWTKQKEATLAKFSENIIKFTRDTITEKFASEIADAVNEAYNQHVELHGERDMAPMLGSNVDDWDSTLDDALEAIVEDYVPDLSQDWLATATTGGSAGLHEEGGAEKWCLSFGKEIWKQATYQKTPAQQLAAIGIVGTATIEQWFAYGQSTGTTVAAQADADQAEHADMDDALNSIIEYFGDGFDEAEVKDALDMVMDDDDILAAGAAARIGLGDDGITALRAVKDQYSPSAVIDLLNDLRSGATPSVASPKAAKRDPGAPRGDAIPPSVLMALKEHSAAQDGGMAEALGVSRGTYTNYQKGKTDFNPTTEQRTVVQDRLVTDILALVEAYDELTGGNAAVGVQELVR